MTRSSLILVLVLAGSLSLRQTPSVVPAAASSAQFVQSSLDEWRASVNAPGASLAVIHSEGLQRVVSGVSDRRRTTPMSPDDLMLAGSVGKTFFAALAVQMIEKGSLDLDAPISRYLETRSWFGRLPKAASITVRQLMTHTSGLTRYEMLPAFTAAVRANPNRIWSPEEQIGYLFDKPAPFAPGAGWDYSDTNFIILGIIMQEILKTNLYEEVQRRFLTPLGLQQVRPSTSRRIPGLIPGYAGSNDPLGLPDEVMQDGVFAVNPQFEWTGGGFATSAGDLARWGDALYRGNAISERARKLMIGAAVPARLGPETQYGLGVIIRAVPGVGATWGHSGFFPGYQAELIHLVQPGITLALQVNTSATRPPGTRSPLRFLRDIAPTLAAGRRVK